MMSDSEDDLCIFVCGTCKRYFTQLSSFSQHKKEKLCKRKSTDGVPPNKSVVGNHIADETSEEVDTDENLDVLDGQNISDCFEEQLMRTEENCLNSQKRKYPRKQDKAKIKRTVRDFDTEGHLLISENAELCKRSQSRPEANGDHEALRGRVLSMVPFSNQAQGERFSRNTSEIIDGTCRHPVYTCKICHAEFPNNHGRLYKCLHCRRGFFTEGDLKQHVVSAKHNNLCEVCGKIFPDKYKLRKHSLSHVTEKNFHCELPGCTKAFKSADDLKTHVKYVHAPEKRFKCTKCPRAFSRPDKYKLHVLKHTEISISGLRPTTVGVFDKGQSPVNNDLVVALYNANNTLGNQDSSNLFEKNVNHLSENNVNPSFDDRLSSVSPKKGPENDTVCTASSSRMLAETTCTSSDFVAGPKDENICNVTDEGSSTKSVTPKEESAQENYQQVSCFPSSNLATHNLTSEGSSFLIPRNSIVVDTYSIATNGETGGTPFAGGQPEHSYSKYVCNYCGRKFNQNETLTHHIQEHLAKMSAGKECVRCKSHFLTSTELVAHEERRPDHVLRCDHCSGKFLSICELRFHLRETHNIINVPEASPSSNKNARHEITGQNQKHRCTECGKVFTRADKLRRHAIIHSPDRPCIPCKCRESHGCMLTFYRKDSMKRHALTHTLEKPYKCDICDKTFSRQDYVTKHISHVHKRIFKHRCTLCDYGTREPKRLRIHIRSRHEIDPDTLPPPLDSNSVFGLDDYLESFPEVPLENLGDMATSGSTWPDGGTKDRVNNLDVNSQEVKESYVTDKTLLEPVGEESVYDQSPSSTMSEDVIQQCGLSANVAELKQFFAVPCDVSITESQEDTTKDDRLKIDGNEHKTPLNSLPVSS